MKIENFPWEDKPDDCNDIVWRYSKNPIIDRYAIPSSNSIFNSGQLTGLRMLSATALACDCIGANFQNANFTATDWTGTNFTGANLINASFSGADVTNCVFIGASLISTSFLGATITGATFPDGYVPVT